MSGEFQMLMERVQQLEKRLDAVREEASSLGASLETPIEPTGVVGLAGYLYMSNKGMEEQCADY